MKTKYFLIGTIAAGLTLFVWQSINHVVIPLEHTAVREFSDPKAVLEVVRTHSQGNGMYFLKEGVLAAVAFRPGMAEMNMKPFLATQFVNDLLVAFLLAAALLSVPRSTPWGCASFTLLIGLAASVSIALPQWNWYGFTPLFTLVSFMDTVVGWFLAGLVLGLLKKKYAPQAG